MYLVQRGLRFESGALFMLSRRVLIAELRGADFELVNGVFVHDM